MSINLNQHGGIYENGHAYPMSKKMEVLAVYFHLVEEEGGAEPTFREIARRAKVSTKYAWEVVTEYKATGGIANPNSEERRLQSQP